MVSEKNQNTLPSSHILSTIIACFEPVFMQDAFSFSFVDTSTLQIYCQKWGEIGTISISEITPSGQPEPRLGPPHPIPLDELPKYESLLRNNGLGHRGQLAYLMGRQDIYQETVAEVLYEKRVQRQQEFGVWLSNRLQIFGYRNLYFRSISDSPGKINEQFDFPVKGTPAQLGVMLRQFVLTLRSKPNYYRLAFQILLPGSRKNAENIPPDANPIEIRLMLEKSHINVYAHTMPSNGTLLRVHMIGEKSLWELWDVIRDELGKLGWFSLPEIPQVLSPIPSLSKTPIETQSQSVKPPIEIWMTIPDVGPNREILRHWHKGLPCEQIAVRVSLSTKTVLNRINTLRKEYGSEIVPYRKSNFIHDFRKKPS